MSDKTYFYVLSFSIYDRDNQRMMEISPDKKDFILNKKYPLNSMHDIHYDPQDFFNFLIEFSYSHPNIKFDVFYKYGYVNHDHINTYQNRMTVYNGFIHDRLMG